MIWAFFGILSSLFRAAFAETNRILKADTWQLNFWHALFGLLLMLPFSFGVNWGSLHPYVYLAAGLAALVLTAAALMQLNLSNIKTARVSSMHLPAESIFAFILWFFIMPGSLDFYLKNPQATSLIGLAFVLTTVGLMRIRDNDMGLKGLAAILPGAATFGGLAVLVKALVHESDLPDAAFIFVFVAYATMTLIMALILLVRRKAKEELVDTSLVRAGLTTGILSAASLLCFIYSLVYASSPVYPIIVSMLVPVWLMVYHKAKKIDDQAKPLPAGLIVLGVLILVYASSM
jgi:hypothetical protein